MNMCSEKITNLAKAMLKVQKQLRPALKDNYNGFTQSRYATLNSVMEACGEALINAGIWVTQYPVPVEGDGSLLGLVTKLVHAESGEWQESLLVMPLPKADPQGYGSALTYARRYGLSAMVGLLAEDDDANLACNPSDLKGQNNGNFDLQTTRIVEGKRRKNDFVDNSSQNDVLENLPHIDGVSYQQQKAKDGTVYITAAGNVRNKNSILKETGFKWNANRKLWWKAA
ncbi:MAG: ERF family protein [Victivallaceae bacterium]